MDLLLLPEGQEPRARPARLGAGEAGEQYHELRGVLLKTRVELHRELEDVSALGAEILTRYGGAPGPEVEEAVRQQASKRVALRFVPEQTASWDHRKLGASY